MFEFRKKIDIELKLSIRCMTMNRRRLLTGHTFNKVSANTLETICPIGTFFIF